MSHATRALRWTLLGTSANRALSFLGLAIIGRIISEENFGEYRQIISIHLVLCAGIGLGFDQLFIREVRHRRVMRVVLGGAVLLWGTVLALALVAAAPWLSRALQLGESAPLLYLAAGVLLLQSIKGAWKAECVARLAFRRITTAEALNTFVTMVIGAGLMFVSASAWMLYLAYAAGELLEFALLRPRGETGRALVRRTRLAMRAVAFGFRRHRRFSTIYTIDQVMNTLSAQIPVFVLASFFGKSAAGTFGMANALIQTPFILLIGPLSRVALPALSGRTAAQMSEAALRIMQAGGAFVSAVVVWVAAFAPHVVALTIGAKWIDDVPLVILAMSVYLVVVPWFSPISVIDVLKNRPDVTFLWNGTNLLVRIGVLAAASHLGLVWTMGCYGAASLVMWLIYGVALAWLLGCGQWNFWRAILRHLPLLVAFGVVQFSLARALPHPLIGLLASAVPAAIYYALTLRDPLLRGVVTQLLSRKKVSASAGETQL